ncbi:YgeY family selenium metabolism-linked hydrolase [Crassaminicella profunda]|uniref:YgeY family selenium metabolism-linked hydrolase n=1 Tax=Crassaminicella profunda TaxID=1286698 RepID=UPI001CA79F9E|nr:YgeY family selenium metabolism-linked hydrolase [Crassaminicella profunda]QZY54818.1 YgeY family selenium metabolism-linked hydrolase [Crassaminicella profunda]
MNDSIVECFSQLRDDLIKFTQKLVRIESYTGKEQEATELVKAEMEKLGYDEVIVDNYGSVLGRVGSGDTKIIYDAHIDVVEAKDANEWKYGAFSGEIVDGAMYGRGTVDTKSSVCAMIYAGHAMKKLGLLEDKTVYISASVMEEDFDGELLFRVIEEQKLDLDYTIIGEPSNLQLAVGHRGRSMYTITTKGVSAHGSAPNNGVNAIYKMAKILSRVENQQKEFDKINGEKGSVVVSNIEARTASLNAVPDQCKIYLDRRLALGETEEMVAKEMDKIIEGTDATWEIYNAIGKSATGKDVVLRTFMPAWETAEDHQLTQAAIKSFNEVLEKKPEIFKWEFSTNGFATNGRFNVPTIGFGPGEMKYAHMKDEHCKVEDIVTAAKVYTALIKYL